jgi:N-acetylglutamate synthase-like GNAT family acetyltransferase
LIDIYRPYKMRPNPLSRAGIRSVISEIAPEAPVTISAFEPADEEGVLSMILAIQREEFGLVITADDQPDLRTIREFYQSGAGGFWVARSAATVIGTIGLKDIGARQGALRKMFVAKPHRGQGQAIASRLLEKLFAAAESTALTRIFLGTTDKFHAAHRFYEKNGFSTIPKESLPAAFPVMAVDTKFYAIDLPRTA